MKKYTHYQSNFPNVFINYSGKDGNFIVKKLEDITLIIWSQLISQEVRHKSWSPLCDILRRTQYNSWDIAAENAWSHPK